MLIRICEIGRIGRWCAKLVSAVCVCVRLINSFEKEHVSAFNPELSIQ